MFGAVLSSYNACLNSAGALYTCDFHEPYVNRNADPKRIGKRVAVIFTIGSLAMVPLYEHSRSIVDTIQRLNGLYSMPVLSAFIAAIAFSQINALAVKIGMLFGVALYALFTFVWSPLHYIHLMAITLFSALALMLLVDRVLKTVAAPAIAHEIN
jgi:SSS family solute:Na+ symporter